MRNAKLLVVAALLGIIFNLSAIFQADAVPQLLDVVDPSVPAAITDPIVVSALYEQSDRLVFIELHNVSERAVDISGWQVQLKVQGISAEQPIEFELSGYMLADSYISFVDEGVSGMGAFSFSGTSFGVTSANKLEYVRLIDASGGIQHTTVIDGTVSGFTTKWWSRESNGYSGIFSLDFTGHTSDASINHTPLYEQPQFNDDFRIVEVFSRSRDCSPADEEWWCHDYIKLYVPASQQQTDSFVVRTDSSSSRSTVANTFSIPASQEGYVTIRTRDDGQPIEMNESGYVWLEDMTGKIGGLIVNYSAGDGELGSWALGSDNTTWWWTTQPNPDGANIIDLPVEKVTICPEGKYLNPDTGRCRTVEEAVNALSACPEGQYRNPLTNRCKQIASTTSTLVPCGEGQERNPLTNRCRSIASAVAELLPCDEGYERNPATNRCRKVAGVATTASSSGQLVEEDESAGPNIWTWSLLTVVVVGAVGYGVYEWRHELAGAGKSIAAKFSKK